MKNKISFDEKNMLLLSCQAAVLFLLFYQVWLSVPYTQLLFFNLDLRECVCVCVWERERKREKGVRATTGSVWFLPFFMRPAVISVISVWTILFLFLPGETKNIGYACLNRNPSERMFDNKKCVQFRYSCYMLFFCVAIEDDKYFCVLSIRIQLN